MATCCVTVTNTLQGVCCPPGQCPRKVKIIIELKSTMPSTIPLYDLDTNAQIVAGPVWSYNSLDASCAWTSCDLVANSSIGPLNQDSSPATYYEVTQIVEGVPLDPIQFLFDEQTTPAICGTTQNLTDVAITGAVQPGSPICDYLAACLGTSGALDLDDLGDVDATLPNDGDTIIWSTANQLWETGPPPGGAGADPTAIHYDGSDEFSTINEDGTPENDDWFLYEQFTGGAKRKIRWSAMGGGGGGSSTLAGLTDTDITAATDEQGLVYDNVSSKWENRYSRVFDIRNYGASTAATNNEVAINAAVSAAAGVGIVYIPDGVWRCSARVDFTSYTHIKGSSRDRSQIKFEWENGDQPGGNIHAYVPDGHTNVTIEDVWFKGGHDAGTPWGSSPPAAALAHLIWFTNTKQIFINNCILSHASGFALQFNGTSRVKVTNCEVAYNGRDGVNVTGGGGDPVEEITVSNNKFHHIGDDAIAIYDQGQSSNLGEQASNFTVAAGDNEVFSSVFTAGMVGTELVIEGAGPGGTPLMGEIQSVNAGVSATIESWNIASAAVSNADGVYDWRPAKNIVIVGNEIRHDETENDSGGRGIVLSGVKGATLTGNALYYSARNGVLVQPSQRAFNGTDTIFELAVSQNINATGNSVTYTGIGQAGAECGARLHGQAYSKFDFTIHHPIGDGMEILNSFFCEFSGVIRGAESRGIQLGNTSAPISCYANKISDLIVENCGGSGIVLTDADETMINDCMVMNNGWNTTLHPDVGNRCGISIFNINVPGLTRISNVRATDTRTTGKTQQRGLNAASTNISLQVDECDWSGNAGANYTFGTVFAYRENPGDGNLTDRLGDDAGVNKWAVTDDSDTEVGSIDSLGNFQVTGLVNGRDLVSDGSKLNGIETGAQVNPTHVEIADAAFEQDHTFAPLAANGIKFDYVSKSGGPAPFDQFQVDEEVWFDSSAWPAYVVSDTDNADGTGTLEVYGAGWFQNGPADGVTITGQQSGTNAVLNGGMYGGQIIRPGETFIWNHPKQQLVLDGYAPGFNDGAGVGTGVRPVRDLTILPGWRDWQYMIENNSSIVIGYYKSQSMNSFSATQFEVGETATGQTSGKTATIVYVPSSGGTRTVVYSVEGRGHNGFNNSPGEVIVGANSGAQATVQSGSGAGSGSLEFLNSYARLVGRHPLVLVPLNIGAVVWYGS